MLLQAGTDNHCILRISFGSPLYESDPIDHSSQDERHSPVITLNLYKPCSGILYGGLDLHFGLISTLQARCSFS